MLPLNAHPLIQQSYDVSQAIEVCGASQALTAAAIKSSALTEAISNLVQEQCLTGPTCIPLAGLQPHEVRVVIEKAQLDLRLSKLGEFLGSDAFKNLADEDRILLINQHGAMMVMSRILGQRIERFAPVSGLAGEGEVIQ